MSIINAQKDPIHILLVDDEQSIQRLIQKELGSPQRIIKTAGRADQALEMTRSQMFDVILLDICLPDADGLEVLDQFWEIQPEVEVILITGYGDIDSAVTATKMGGYDYITKPFKLERLTLVIEKAYQRVCLKKENRLLRHTQKNRGMRRLIGNSPGIEQVRFMISKVAPTPTPVLITGESGTGKNVVAQAIHNMSMRANRSLIVKNCGTLQENLIASELFGHCRGAFTGATHSREGLLMLAHKGTLFLDEIGELSPELQSMLLRLLENQTYRRVGEKDERKVDIRFLFATNRNLSQEVAAGRFSDALYHRLKVFDIELTPLRERPEDIPSLVDYFLQRLRYSKPACRISREATRCLFHYHWPGNVRELKNVIERAIILSEKGLISGNCLPRELVEASDETEANTPFMSLKELEKKHIDRVLQHVNGNRTRAAEILGIGRKTLYRKLNNVNLPKNV
jgi:two-component system NtrC family response regulator